MYLKSYPKHPDHAILLLEGGEDEVLHISALGKDLQIEIRIDEAKTGVVILTPDGVRRWAIPGRRLDEADVPKETDAKEGAV